MDVWSYTVTDIYGGGGGIHPQIDSNMDVWSYTVTDIYGGGGGGYIHKLTVLWMCGHTQ